MTTAPAHTPYDGSSKPFAIGLKPIGFERWIEIDAHYPAYLQEKRRLYAQVPEKVFVAEPGTEAAQQEVSDLIAGHLHRHFPNLPAVPLPEPAGNALREHPLYRASLRVQEDLILMRRGETGWRLAAGSLCFPSSWSLREKFGRPLEQIHVPVPGFGPGSRPDQLIARMFDALSPDQLMERYNWSIQAGDALYLPLSDEARDERAASRPSKFPDGDLAARAFIRVERQTLRKLPSSRDVLFTIRIHLDPLKVLAGHPERARLASSFAAQLAALDEEQLDYKGMTADRDRLVEHLLSMTDNG